MYSIKVDRTLPTYVLLCCVDKNIIAIKKIGVAFSVSVMVYMKELI